MSSKTTTPITNAEKQAKLEDLLQRMHPSDRAAFKRALEKFKPNLDHDLFVASMHVPPSLRVSK